MSRLVDERNADMDAWGLTWQQRDHHLTRVGQYYRTVHRRSERARGRIQRIEVTAALGMLCWVVTATVLLWLVR